MNPDSFDTDVSTLQVQTASRSIIERHNLAVVERLHEALQAGQPDLVRPELTDDIALEIIGPAVVPSCGQWAGKADVLAALHQHSASIHEPRPELVSRTARGDVVVVVLRERGQSLHNDAPYDIHWVQIFTFCDGMLCRVSEVADGLDLALAFLG